jgi:hypothetical protein
MDVPLVLGSEPSVVYKIVPAVKVSVMVTLFTAPTYVPGAGEITGAGIATTIAWAE